ncbi:hypothetical protein [Cellulomonas sp. NPDC058312]|uniref:hypothetical protein n=1 Tax=Cellulomonas sp. NPDC058312 TaxID=3346441 RepID=UPI0036EEA7EF
MSHEDRIARARAALASAELRTGARSLARVADTAPAAPAPPAPTAPAPAAPALAAPAPSAVGLVQGTAALAGAQPVRAVPRPSTTRTVPRPASPSGPVAVPDLPAPPGPPVGAPSTPPPATAPVRASRGSVLLTDRPPLAVPPALAPLLPDGLRRGSTTAVLGSTSLVLAMIAAACTAREAWAAVVGQPSLGLLAAAQSGVALDRLAVVPRPGVDTPTVVAALLDGIDVVVVGPAAHLADSDRRRLMARARDRGSVLLSTAPWSGAGTVLTVEGGRWTGVGDGDGRLRAHELHVTRTGRGSAGQAQDLRVVLPLEVGADPYGIPDRPARPVVEAPAPGLRLVG